MSPQIHHFNDFCAALDMAGFSQGDSGDNVFSLSAYFGPGIRWHTGNEETDPWEWRMRVLRERNDVAYAKLFFGQSGYITKEWYPYFLAARRGDDTAEDAYTDGRLSQAAMRIYRLIEEQGEPSLTELKRLGQFSREDKSVFDKALIDLQARMFITISGARRKSAVTGQEYGWSITVFRTSEAFFGDDVHAKARSLNRQDAYAAIEARVLILNSAADGTKVKKFILGE